MCGYSRGIYWLSIGWDNRSHIRFGVGYVDNWTAHELFDCWWRAGFNAMSVCSLQWEKHVDKVDGETEVEWIADVVEKRMLQRRDWNCLEKSEDMPSFYAGFADARCVSRAISTRRFGQRQSTPSSSHHLPAIYHDVGQADADVIANLQAQQVLSISLPKEQFE